MSELSNQLIRKTINEMLFNKKMMILKNGQMNYFKWERMKKNDNFKNLWKKKNNEKKLLEMKNQDEK